MEKKKFDEIDVGKKFKEVKQLALINVCGGHATWSKILKNFIFQKVGLEIKIMSTEILFVSPLIFL